MMCEELLLIADDNQDVINILVPTLSDYYEVIEARTGKEAIELYDEHRPDIVVMDYVMPDMDGAEATKQILAMDRHARVIGITGYSPEGREAMIKAGALHVVEKPFKVINVIEAISKHIKNISNGVTRQRMFVVEREVANQRMEMVNLRSQFEQLRLTVQNSIKMLYGGAKKYGLIGIVGWNVISIVLNLIEGLVEDPSTFVGYINNNTTLIISTAVGMFVALLFAVPYLYKKLFKSKVKKDYLMEFSGINDEVNNYIYNNMHNGKNKKKKRKFFERRLI